MEGKDEDGNYVIKNNGVWTNTTINIPELIATYIKVWLEDSVPNELLESMKQSTGQYTEEKQVEAVKNVYNGLLENRKKEIEAMIQNFESKLTANTQ
jgi:hypothetical protein